MRQSAHILRQVMEKMPTGPINVADWKNMLPPKSHVMTKMEELIHHFIVVTEGLDAPPGEIYFGAENPKGELGFYINSKGGGVPHRLKIRSPSFVNLSILPELLPGPSDQRCRRHPRQSGLRHGRMRQMTGMRFLPLALIACLVIGLTSCGGPRLRKANVDEVEKGMAKKQVESILGPPTTIDLKDFAALKKTIYIYTQGKDTVTVIFKDDKVELKESTLTD